MQNFNTKQPVIHRLFELLALLFTLKSDHNCVQAHAGFQHSWNGLHTPISVNRKLLNEVQTGVNEFIDPEVDTMKWKNNERTELNATLYNQIEETFKSFDLNQCEVFFADQYKISLKKYENFILEQAISSVLQSSDPADTIILAQNVFNNGHSSGEGWHQDVFPEIDEVVDPTSSTIMFSFGKYACAYEDPSQRPFNKDLQKEIRSFCQNLDYPPLLAAQVPLTMNIFVSGIRSGAYDFQDSTESPEVAVEHMVQSLCKGIESEWNFLIHRVEMYYMNLGWISALMYQEDTQYYHYSYSSENKLVNTNIAESNNTDIYSTNAAATGDDGVVKNLTQDFNLESEATQYESHNYSATVEQENTQSNAIEVTNNETQIDTYQPDFENYKVESDNPLSTIEEVMEQNKDDTAAAEINNEGVLYMLMKFQVKALQKFDQEQIAMIVKQELQKIVLSQLYQIAENTFRETQNGYEVQEDLSDFKDTRRHLGVNGPTHRYMGEKSEPSSMLQKPPELIHADVNLYPLGEIRIKYSLWRSCHDRQYSSSYVFSV